MDLSSQPIVLPTTHRRRFLTTTRTPMFIDAAPVAVSNKIKAIQARKTRLNPITNTAGYTDIRTLNFSSNNGMNNGRGNVTIWTAERLVDRSKDIRLDRIPTRRSVLSTTSINQPSLLWPNYQSSAVGNKQLQTNSNSTTTTPPAVRSIKNKSPGGKMPEIPRRRNRPPLIDQHNSPILIELPLVQSSVRTIHPTEEIEDDEEIVIDKEFEEYFEQAIRKCADWLLKYVFIEKNN